MPTLVISAPKERVGVGPTYKSFGDTYASGIGRDYAIVSRLAEQITPGWRVVLLSKDEHKRAEGQLVQLVEATKAGNGIQRYDVHIRNLKMVPYVPEDLNRNGVAVIL